MSPSIQKCTELLIVLDSICAAESDWSRLLVACMVKYSNNMPKLSRKKFLKFSFDVLHGYGVGGITKCRHLVFPMLRHIKSKLINMSFIKDMSTNLFPRPLSSLITAISPCINCNARPGLH